MPCSKGWPKPTPSWCRGTFLGTYPRQWARAFGSPCTMTYSQVLEERLGPGFSLDGPIFTVPWPPQGPGEEGTASSPPPTIVRVTVPPSGAGPPWPPPTRFGGSIVPADEEDVMGMRPAPRCLAPPTAPMRALGAPASESQGPVGSRLDRTGPTAPEPLKSNSKPCQQSQPHTLPRSMASHITRGQASANTGPSPRLGPFSLKGTVSGPLQGQLPELCQPLERPASTSPHFTDEQTEGRAPWPGLADHSCSQHIFIEH